MKLTQRTLPFLSILAPLAAAALLPGFGVCAEEENAPQEPPDEAQVARWIADLGDEDFWTRDQAMRGLEPWVDCFWPQMAEGLGDEDNERTRHLRDLAHAAGIVPADEAAGVKELLRSIGLEKDNGVRSLAYAHLLRFGQAGRLALQAFVRGTGARPVAITDPPEKKWVPYGSEVTIRGRMVLRDAPCWTRRGYQRFSMSENYMRLGKLRPRNMGGRLRRCISSCCGGRTIENPLFYWTMKEPGAVLDVGSTTRTLDRIGRYTFYYYGSIGQQTLKTPGCGGPAVEVQINSDLPMTAEQEGGPVNVWALPDFGTPGGDGCLEMHADAAVADGFVRASAEIAPAEGVEARFLLEASLPRYAWYLVLDREGVPVGHGEWVDVLDGDAQEAATVHEILPGRPATWNLKLPAPKVPGVYRLAIGYAVGAPAYDPGEPQFPNAEAHPDAEPYTQGLLWAASDPFEVPAPTPAER